MLCFRLLSLCNLSKDSWRQSFEERSILNIHLNLLHCWKGLDNWRHPKSTYFWFWDKYFKDDLFVGIIFK